MSQPSPSRQPAPQVWGYIPEYDYPAAWASAEAHRDLLTGVSLFQYRLDAQGDLVEYPDLGATPIWAAESGLALVAMVTNLVGDRWDRDLVATVLADPQRRRHHLAQLLGLAETRYAGLELDYENLAAADRAPLTAFVQELAEALHQRGKTLSLAVHAKLAEPGESPGAQAQDWAALGAAADRIVVMTYDHDPSRPGPIAPIDWSRSVLEFALTRIPSHRVLQGIPFYGYDWTDQGAADYVTCRDLMALAQAHGAEPRRDPVDQHLVMTYQAGDVSHEVWIPDAQTVEALMEVGRDLGVAGYGIWRLGGEDPAAWPAVARAAPG